MNIFTFNSVYKLRDVRRDGGDRLPQLRAGGTKEELKILLGCERGEWGRGSRGNTHGH